jgi:hypothetical protein
MSDPRRVTTAGTAGLAQSANATSKRAAAVQSRASGGLVIPRVSVFRKEAQSIPHNTWTGVLFDFEEFDTDLVHEGTTDDQFVFTTDTAGVWMISMGCYWGTNETASRRMRVRINDTATLPQSEVRIMATGATADGDAVLQSAFMATLQEGDTISVQVAQFSGDPVNITMAYFQAHRIGI